MPDKPYLNVLRRLLASCFGRRTLSLLLLFVLPLASLSTSPHVDAAELTRQDGEDRDGDDDDFGDPSEEEEDADDADDPWVFHRIGGYEDAIELFEKRIAKDPENAEWARGLAQCLEATGEYEAALAALTKSPALAESSTVQSFRGRVLARTGQLKEAETALREAVRLDAKNVEALNRLGRVLRQTGRREEAQATWNQVIDVYQALDYDEAKALPAEGYVEMGLALISLNRYADATDVMFSQAQEQDKTNPFLLLSWGRAFQDKYDWPAARESYRDAFKENPNYADGRVSLAENYLLDFQVGTARYGLAEKQIQRALDINPKHDGAMVAQGSLWLSDGNIPEALEQFQAALEINPANVRARGLLAACHFLNADKENLERVEKETLAINSQAGEFYHTIANAIERRFRYKDAARMSKKALAVDEDYWPAYHTLAINLLRTGAEEDGRFYLDKSWEKDPYNVWVLNTRKLLRHMDKKHRVVKTDHFLFKLPKDDALVYETYLIPSLEEAYERISASYDTQLDPPIQIEVFTSHKWFSARLVGLEGVPAAGACFGNLVILSSPKALPQNWAAVAWHEFAHVVTLYATGHRIPRWFTEGISVYEEGKEHPAWARNFEREIADAYGSGRLLGIDELDFGFTKPKYPGQVLMSYYQGCMIVQYIIDKWNFEKVVELVKGYATNRSPGEIFQDVFSMSTADFDEGFFAWLEARIEANGYTPTLTEDVIEPLQILLEDSPDDVAKLVRLAWAYRCSSNDIDGPRTAARAKELDPTNGDACAILGFFHLDAEKPEKAKAEFERALELGTRFRFRVYTALASMAEKGDDKEKALELYVEAKDISPRAGAAVPQGKNLYYKIAALQKELDREEDSIATLEAVRALSSEDPRCRMELAAHYLQQDDKEAAEKAAACLDEVIYINPFDRKVHEQLAMASVRAERHDLTIREYEFLLEFAGDANPRTAHKALMRAYLATGKKAKAASSARRVLEFDEEDEDAQAVLEAAEA